MDYAEVRRLVKLVESSRIQELELEREGTRIRVSKGTAAETYVQAIPQPVPAPMASAAPSVAVPANQPSTAPAASLPVAGSDKKYHEIKSPMVGTFYRAPAPDAPPYVKEGDTVGPGQTLCIVEAMKLMNEIESDIAGKVISIEVQNATPVEFGQVLFKIATQG